MQRRTRPIVAVFAATDPTVGAGIGSDCRVLAANHCLTFAITTAVTAQNLNGVQAYWPLSARRVTAQLATANNTRFAAVKIGVIGNAAHAIISDIAPHPRIVWDPVLAPTSGVAFVGAAQQRSLSKRLLPHVFVTTPNRRELLQLTDEKRVATAVAKLRQIGVAHVLVTDIDGRGKTVKHALFGDSGKTAALWEAETKRLPGVFHGSGCFFSATLTAALAHGDSITRAAQTAHERTARALRQASAVPSLGKQRLLY